MRKPSKNFVILVGSIIFGIFAFSYIYSNLLVSEITRDIQDGSAEIDALNRSNLDFKNNLYREKIEELEEKFQQAVRSGDKHTQCLIAGEIADTFGYMKDKKREMIWNETVANTCSPIAD
jgi:hypothetical protein